MNFKKIISYLGVAFLSPISKICALWKSKMTEQEAHNIITSVYDIDRNDYAYIGGAHIPSLQPNTLDISFVIPVFNGEQYLERCVRSILSQTTTACYEVVCINDGSTDSSLDILHRLKEAFPEKLVVVSQENQGISVTRNRGIEMAKGKYVGFLDNDDFVSEGFVEKMWQKCKYDNADIVQIGYNIVNVSGEVVSFVSHQDLCIVEEQKLMNKYVNGYIWSGLYLKKMFEKVRFPIGFWYEDMITKMLLARLCHKYVFVSECLYNKLIHNNNASAILWSGRNAKCIDHLYLLKKFAEYNTDVLSYEKDEVLWELVMGEMSLLWNRTKGMSRKVREAVFVLGGSLLHQYAVMTPHIEMSKEKKRFSDDFYNKHYWKWEVDGFLALFEAHL